MDAHDLVAAAKTLALGLGRTPTRDEFIAPIRSGRFHIDRHFGSYAALLTAAGLDPARHSRDKIDNSIFQTSLSEHLDKYEPRESVEEIYDRIASISDIHWPFQSQRVVDKFYSFIDREKPKYVLIDGDAQDKYSHGRFPRSHNVFTPREEEDKSRALNEEFWRIVKRLVPDAECVQMMGNHDVRPLKQVLDRYPEAEDWIKERMVKMFTFEGVKTIHDPREELMIGSIMVHHGYRSKLGDHRDYSRYNSIVGHTHRGGVVFRRIHGKTLWELNCGLAGDPEAKGLTYTPQKITDWTPGFGFVDEYGPRFIPC